MIYFPYAETKDFEHIILSVISHNARNLARENMDFYQAVITLIHYKDYTLMKKLYSQKHRQETPMRAPSR